jgi:hypothetical protein
MNYKQTILVNKLMKNNSVEYAEHSGIIHIHIDNTKYKINLINADSIELYGINYSDQEITIILLIKWDYTNNEYILDKKLLNRNHITATVIACEQKISTHQYILWLLRQIVLSQ